jgi:hypothetical protein
MGRDRNVAIEGQAYALTALTPIHAGHETELRDLLAAIPVGEASPFARVPGTHFARLVIIDRLAYEGRRERTPELGLQYLLFSSIFDGPLEDYLRALCARIPDEADEIWGGCVGAPQPVAADAGAFAAWIRHNQVRTGVFFAPCGTATVDRINHSIDLCRGLRQFAQETQYLTAPDLKERFDTKFGSKGAIRDGT